MKEEGWERVVPYLYPEKKPYAVDILLVESVNVIWKYNRKYRLITKEEAFKLCEIVMKLIREKVITIEPGEKYLKRGLKIAIEYDISIYDSLFLAQAKGLEAELVTSDKRQRDIARDMNISVVYIE